MASAHDLFHNRKYKKLVINTNFDEEKIQFLESYIKDLRE